MKSQCDSCGRSMVDPVTGTSFVGIAFDLGKNDVTAFQRVYPELTSEFAEIAICWTCWIKSLGGKVDNA